ncbi:MAG TPA: nuclear transport factor 2 family protein [Steroidobacteraceae bacterium]|jgi:hypothetical protein
MAAGSKWGDLVLKSQHSARHAQTLAAGLMLVLSTCGVWAQPPAEPKGNFLSSLKQAFRQDYDHEVVRGHFEVGSAPDVHRYYCLVDPKTGKSESNGVGGKPFVRPDGMTGIKEAAVSFYSCADAERQGILVTIGYALNGVTARITPPQPVPAKPAAPTSLPAEAPAQNVPAVPQAEMSAAKETPVEREVLAAFTHFIAADNAHDGVTVSESLLDSKDLVWAGIDGRAIWGHQEVLAALQRQSQGTWRLEPPSTEPRIASISAGVAVLIAPMVLTQGSSTSNASSSAVRWAGVFVKTRSGWRITSVFISPSVHDGGAASH